MKKPSVLQAAKLHQDAPASRPAWNGWVAMPFVLAVILGLVFGLVKFIKWSWFF